MKIAAIHQPGYFPWMGVIDKIARCDVFVLLDNVQFNRAAYQHRTLYSTREGAKLLTLPVKKAGFLQTGLQIRDVELADARTPAKHFQTLKGRYGKTPGWPAWEEQIQRILACGSLRLMDYAWQSLQLTLQALGVERRIVFASDMDCSGAKSALVINLVKATGCDTYLSGMGAKEYQTPSDFEAEGIALLYQNLEAPQWRQSHGGEYQPGCFALEWALENGAETAELFARYLNRTAPNAMREPRQI